MTADSTTIATDSITITRPDDWHIHLRDRDALLRTVNDAARQFERAIVMPNLVPPVINSAQAAEYRNRILGALEPELSFDPLMVLYLTDSTSADTVAEAKQSGIVQAFKWYPAGATTNSDSGVTSLEKIYPALEAMQKHNIVLAVHGEVTDSDIDIFDREAAFIDRTLNKVTNDFPELRIVFEHITTKNAVEFVDASSAKVAATITAHHLLFNRNHMLAGGIRPHYYCLPILKREEHRQALIKAATSGDKKYFLGTDSAPHNRDKKESSCGCAGTYTAYSALEFYAQVFEEQKKLENLEAFAAFNGADFYQLPRNKQTVTLKKKNWQIPQSLPMGTDQLTPCMAGEEIRWKIV